MRHLFRIVVQIQWGYSLLYTTSRPRILKHEDILFNSYNFIRENKQVL